MASRQAVYEDRADNHGFTAHLPAQLNATSHIASQCPPRSMSFAEHYQQLAMTTTAHYEHSRRRVDEKAVSANNFTDDGRCYTDLVTHGTYSPRNPVYSHTVPSHPSFFTDSLGTSPEESTLFDATYFTQTPVTSQGIPIATVAPHTSNIYTVMEDDLARAVSNPTMQKSYTENARPASPLLSANSYSDLRPVAAVLSTVGDSSPMLAVTSPVHTNVDPSQYEYISDWSRASVCFEDLAASSPESIATSDTGPVTPGVCFDASNNERTITVGGWVDYGGLPYDHPGQKFGYGRWRALDGSDGGSWAYGVPHYPLVLMENDTSANCQQAQATRAEETLYAASPSSPATSSVGTSPLSETVMDFENVAGIRKRRDEFLVEMRQKGLSYREIKVQGRFREKESTLRGRFRVLTKPKEDRVRKPAWSANDVRLLRLAVARHLNGAAYGKPGNTKVPWKKVSTWLSEHGGSYHFASATCAKKWEEVKKREHRSSSSYD